MTYRNFKELFDIAKRRDIPVARVILENEMQNFETDEAAVYTGLAGRWMVMRASGEKALGAPQQMEAGLISGLAQKQHEYTAQKGGLAGETVNRAMAYALSGSEVNAAMGRVCAAPTAGACGVLPAVILAVAQTLRAAEQEILDALLVAGGVGAIITANATVSGAEGGCQAECGVAAAMAAAAAITLAGGSIAALGNAVSIALMNCMGLVCDPVAGLVQLPCAYRNASQAVNALISADMALAGQNAIIPPDETVEAMYKVGKKMPVELRETALGGIADTPTGRAVMRQMDGAGEA